MQINNLTLDNWKEYWIKIFGSAFTFIKNGKSSVNYVRKLPITYFFSFIDNLLELELNKYKLLFNLKTDVLIKKKPDTSFFNFVKQIFIQNKAHNKFEYNTSKETYTFSRKIKEIFK